jgi:hypothetical protein
LKIILHNSIYLEKVCDKNLEILRNIRNCPSVQEVLVSKNFIDKEQQKKWFKNIDHSNNHYFILYINDEIEGYTMIKNIDAAYFKGEPGIFLKDKNLYNSTLGAVITISFLDFCNDFFKIEFFFGNVLNSNKRALNNYALFETITRESVCDKEIHITSKARYNEMSKINKIRNYLEKLENYNRNKISVSI